MSHPIEPFAPTILYLLNHPLSSDELGYWKQLLDYLPPIRQHFAGIGIDLLFSEQDGYAILHQPCPSEEETRVHLPRLTTHHRFEYQDMLLGVLLREQLDKTAYRDLLSGRCLLTLQDIYQLLHPFAPYNSNVLVVERKIRKSVQLFMQLEFLKYVTGHDIHSLYEVRRVLKARFTAEVVATFYERMQDHESNSSEE